jgi:hypothetical protein
MLGILVSCRESIKNVYLLFEQIKGHQSLEATARHLEMMLIHLKDTALLISKSNLKEGKKEELTLLSQLLEHLSSMIHRSILVDVEKKQWKSDILEVVLNVIGVPDSLLAQRGVSNDKELLEEIKRLQGLVRVLQKDKDSEAVMKSLNKELKMEFQDRNLSTGSLSLKDPVVDKPPPPPSAPMAPPAAPPGPSNMDSYMILKAPKPTHPLQWEKVSENAIEKSMWSTLFHESYINPKIDESRVLELFAKPDLQPAAIAVRESITNLIDNASETTTFLDHKHSQGIEIFLAQSALTLDQLKIAIVQVDDELLPHDRIDRLISLFPSITVLDQIKQYKGPKPLGVGDRFFAELLTIPRLRQRLQCMLFRYTFQREFAELVPDTIIWRSCVQEIKISQRLKSILQHILVLGNYLNASTFRGNAKGFKITSLCNLRETKSKDEKVPTLLHFLVKELEKEPGLLELMDDLPNLEAARRVSVDALKESLFEITKHLDMLKSELAETKPQEDQFNLKLEPFYLKTEKKVTNLKDTMTRIEQEEQELLDYFGEDGSAHDIFEEIFKFGGLIHSIRNEQEKEEVPVTDQPRMSLLAIVPPPVDGILRLKPVKGMEPFYKRGTVRSARQ